MPGKSQQYKITGETNSMHGDRVDNRSYCGNLDPEVGLEANEGEKIKGAESRAGIESEEKNPVQDENLFLWFARSTIFHGFQRVALARTRVKRIAWIIAIIISFGAVISIVSKRTVTYFQYDTVTETKTEYSSKLPFPAVTICNYNTILKSRMTYELVAVVEPTIEEDDQSGSGGEDTLLNSGSSLPVFRLIDPEITRLQDACSYTTCADGELRCPTSAGRCCLKPEFICDHFVDCLDNLDEQRCSGRRKRDLHPVTAVPLDPPTLPTLKLPPELPQTTLDLLPSPLPAPLSDLPYPDISNQNITADDNSSVLLELNSSTDPPLLQIIPSLDVVTSEGEQESSNASATLPIIEIIEQGETTPIPDLLEATLSPLFKLLIPTESPEGVLVDMSLFEDIEANGWQLRDRNFDVPDETTLLNCVFSKEYCSTKWFKKTVTELGNCYTFNSDQLADNFTDDSGLQRPLVQKISGPLGGLLIKVDIQEYEYTTNNPFVGMKVLIHHPDIQPDTALEGINIGVGQQADIALHYTEVSNHYEPWGRCDKDKTLKLSDSPYSFEACYSECLILRVLDLCQCRPYFYQSDSHASCNNTQWYGCAVPRMAEVDEEFEQLCDCPISCESTTYSPQVSYLPFTNNLWTVKNLNRRFYGAQGRSNYNDYPDATFYQENIVGLRVYYRNMMKTTIKEMKALDEIGLLSEIGGQLGLFVGVSILTMCEIIETMILACIKARYSKTVTG